jgi:hypothetical protein
MKCLWDDCNCELTIKKDQRIKGQYYYCPRDPNLRYGVTDDFLEGMTFSEDDLKKIVAEELRAICKASGG